MDARRVEHVYQEFVVAHGLERSALLETLRARCHGAPTVLYPGSFVHVTPSFFFQHVVYVDKSDFARDFFERADAVVHLVDAHRRYRQKPFLRFLHQDFTAALPLPEASFDVLLALYASGVSRSCAHFVRPGGLLLTNDHRGDAHDAAALEGWALHAVIEERRGVVRVREDGLDGYLTGGRSVADYYLFRRLPERSRAAR